MPSNKFSPQTRGQIAIGLLGVGFAAVTTNVPVNDVAVAWSTLATYPADDYHYTAQVTGNNSDSPYNTGDTANGVMEFRLVGCGIEAKYSGTELNRGGSVILHSHPTNISVPVPFTRQEFMQYRLTSVVPATRKEVSITYRPDSPTQFGYVPFDPAEGTTSLIIFITGAIPGSTWDFRVIQFFECIGARGIKTKSHADPAGMTAVLSSLPSAPTGLTPGQNLANARPEALKNLAEQSGWHSFLTGVGSKAVEVGFGVIGGLIGGPGGARAGAALGSGLNSVLPRDMSIAGKAYKQSVEITEID